jgi:hypothetical protein
MTRPNWGKVVMRYLAKNHDDAAIPARKPGIF